VKLVKPNKQQIVWISARGSVRFDVMSSNVESSLA